MENMDQIIAKVRKVLTLAERASNEHEAAAAAARASELLAKYNLSLGDIKATEETPVERRENQSFGVTKEEWKLTVLTGVASLNFCVHFTQRVYRGRESFVVGQSHNVLVVKHMTEYLIAEIERLAGEQSGKLVLDKLIGATDVTDAHRAYKVGFKQGAAATVQARLLGVKKERSEHQTLMHDGRNLPALVGLYKQEKMTNYTFLAGQGIQLSTRRGGSTKTFSNAGYAAGKSAGQNISLNSQVGHSGGPKRIGRG